ncbi:quinone oxidoreductase family protein [Williamsia soli]|uniref:quinone oxidoreductase family protein n=1 Tax=Williamsia soli TaxID=364929 RepID=UPI001A9E5DC0|nr:quinone oxidoreductase [Williamsia soli]
MADTIRAAVVVAHGGPEVLELQNIPAPEPAEGELVVETTRAGVNFRDIVDRRGDPPVLFSPPYVGGLEGMGRVLKIGAGVSGYSVGDRVAWGTNPGSYTEHALIKAINAVPVPESVSDDQAAGVLAQGLTAHYLTTSVHSIAEGETILVHAGAGGVGGLLIQIAKHRGATVIATVSSPDKAERARRSGADVVADYENFVQVVSDETDGRGVQVAYDGVGAPTLDGTLSSLGVRGLGVFFGGSGGSPETLDFNKLAPKSLTICRPVLPHFVASGEELRTRAAQLFEWIQSGVLEIPIGATFSLAEAAEAHRMVESRTTTGKVLLNTVGSTER